jgi:hypothetical protein
MRIRLALMAVLGTLAGGAEPAAANPRAVTALSPALPVPGAAFDDARAMELDKNQRLICDTDTDKPAVMIPAKLMDPLPGRGSARVRRCSVFQQEPGNIWRQATIPSLAGPARLWLTFVEQGTGHYRLAQLSLWAKRETWDKVAKTMGDILGPVMGAAEGERFLDWQDEQHDVMMFQDEKNPDEFAIACGDTRLRRLMKSPGSPARIE